MNGMEKERKGCSKKTSRSHMKALFEVHVQWVTGESVKVLGWLLSCPSVEGREYITDRSPPLTPVRSIH